MVTLGSVEILILALTVLLGLLLAMYRSGFVAGTIPSWNKQLHDPSEEVRIRTISQLGKIRSPQSAFCLAAMVASRDDKLKALALKALFQIEQPAGLPAIKGALGDRDPKIRRLIAEGLAHFPDPMATRMLVDLLSDLDEVVVNTAIVALGVRKDPRAAKALAHLLGLAEDLARIAAQSLVELGPAAFPGLREMIPELGPVACERLITVLVQLDAQGAIAPILQILSTAPPYLAESALRELASIGGNEVVHALIDYVRHEGRPMRPVALGYLSGVEDAELDDLLVSLLDDRDVKLRRAVVTTLASRPTPERFTPLLRALEDDDGRVVAAACAGLGRYHDPRVIPRLVNLLWPEDAPELLSALAAACRHPIDQIESADEFIPVLQRISSREARGSEDHLIRHQLQSLLILLRPFEVCGFHDLTATILVFRFHEFTSEYQEARLHPFALMALEVMPNQKMLERWKATFA